MIFVLALGFFGRVCASGSSPYGVGQLGDSHGNGTVISACVFVLAFGFFGRVCASGSSPYGIGQLGNGQGYRAVFACVILAALVFKGRVFAAAADLCPYRFIGQNGQIYRFGMVGVPCADTLRGALGLKRGGKEYCPAFPVVRVRVNSEFLGFLGSADVADIFSHAGFGAGSLFKYLGQFPVMRELFAVHLALVEIGFGAFVPVIIIVVCPFVAPFVGMGELCDGLGFGLRTDGAGIEHFALRVFCGFCDRCAAVPVVTLPVVLRVAVFAGLPVLVLIMLISVPIVGEHGNGFLRVCLAVIANGAVSAALNAGCRAGRVLVSNSAVGVVSRFRNIFRFGLPAHGTRERFNARSRAGRGCCYLAGVPSVGVCLWNDDIGYLCRAGVVGEIFIAF